MVIYGLLISAFAIFIIKKIIDSLNAKKTKESLQTPINEIKQFNIASIKFRNQEKYLSNFDIFNFQAPYKRLYNNLNKVAYKKLPKFNEEIKLIDNFFIEFTTIKDLIANRNNDFLKAELESTNTLLSDIEGKSLDNQQRKAIIVNQDNNLIIAGAGSGKTTTIAGKVKYLTQRLKVKPEEILLISFTRKSADEMTERIQDKMNISLPVKTFHKLGLDIISETKNEKPSIFSLSQKELLQLLSSFISNAKSDDLYFNKLIDFLAYYLKPYKSIHEFNSDKDHQNYIKEQKLEGYKIIKNTFNEKTNSGQVEKVTYQYRERFKSQEEVYIANFLFRNNIEYKYEEGYKYKTASKKFGQYKPDFFLPEYNIYIEHFGIDENNNVPAWFKGSSGKSANQTYNEGIEWKRNEHRFNKTTLIESYSWEQRKGILLSNLQTKLENKGVIFNPMFDDELWQYIEQNTPEDIDAFTQLLNTFLVLFKSNNELIKGLTNKAIEEKDERASLFLLLFEPVLKNYESFLKQKNEIDFSDMINLATKSIELNKYKSAYKYIIIDEFQDISKSRYQLIRALLNQKPDTKLFCVGDDWQSIYRFTGSDIGVFTDFTEHFKSSTLKGFERATNTSFIENTYRFDEELIKQTSNFILKNPNQLSKSLKSGKSNFKTLKIIKVIKTKNGNYCNVLETVGESLLENYLMYTDQSNKIGEEADVDLCKFDISLNNNIKTLYPKKNKPISIHKYEDADRKGSSIHQALNKALEEICVKEKDNAVTVLLIGRYEFERRIIEASQYVTKKYNQLENNYEYIYKGDSNLNINFITAHSSKGLEADYVIILNGNSGTYGFPSEISDDPLLNFLLSKADQYPNGEERRLFYVALTRAKKHVHILSSKEYPSKFVVELEGSKAITSSLCEWCDNGKLIERKGPYGYFYACNNKHYCNYTRAIKADEFFEKAKASKKNNDVQEAIDYYLKTLELDKEHYKSCNNLGIIYNNLGQLNEAVQMFKRAVEIKPDHKKSWLNMAVLYKKNDDFNQAIDSFLTYLQYATNENNKDKVYFVIAECYLKLEKFTKALEYCEKAEVHSNGSKEDIQNLKGNIKNLIDFDLKHNYTTKELNLTSISTSEIIKEIEKAIKFEINIKFNYHKSIQFDGGAQSLRTIKPTSFKTVGNSFCVVGNCYMRNEARTFNIDRISNLVLNPKKIEHWSQN